MKLLCKYWCILVFLAVFASGCGPQGAYGPESKSSTQKSNRRGSDNDGPDAPDGSGEKNNSGKNKNQPQGNKVIAPLKPAITGAEAAYSFSIIQTIPYPVIGFKENANPISRHNFIRSLILENQNGQDFRYLVNKAIASLPAPVGVNGYMLQAPLINATTRDDPFYFVAIPQNILGLAGNFRDYFYHCNPRPNGIVAKTLMFNARFWQFFALPVLPALNFLAEGKLGVNQHPFGSAVFKGGGNPGNPQEIMVSPCPVNADMMNAQNTPLVHIYPFTQLVNDKADADKVRMLQSLWFAIGKTADHMFDGAQVKDLDGNLRQDLYLSTHGLGVSYLHFRVETQPLHYHQVPALLNAQQSRAYYQTVFP